ncbi:MAG TPA: polyribonucleotide nucleotidyltransferase, partial [Alphaproteobacteria bacterium]|nr:polyribonucleotide nucleotidyltransferase [Alphaproteobacteria bacterium]
MSIEFKIVREEIIWGGRPLILETGKVARQADGAVVATLGGSVVLCTVVCAKKPKEGINFFPLTVNYQEKTFAVGRIPGGFLKRESKPSEQETLTSRLIDRPIRPLFPDRFYHETQVICTVLSHDGESDLEVLSLIGASAALSISGAPFKGPVAAARVGFNDGEFVLNPTPDQIKAGTLDLVVAGTEEGVLMVESEAKELSEDQMLDAVVFGHTSFEPVLKLITKFKKKAGKKEWSVEDFSKEEAAWVKKIQKSCGKDLKKAFAIKDKQDRYAKRHEIEQKVREEFAQEITDELLFSSSFKKCEAEVLRTDILKNSKRVDGRDLTTVRPIVCETAILPQTHGSSLFTRGETQVLAVTTLGTGQDEQIIDGISGEYRERFMLHYNFPAYSVGETGRLGAPGRREIGHGRLAWRALRPMMPTKEAFPYTVRSVAEVTESNGSSSMATVCSTSLALMEAGVPLAKPVAGIAMGLIKEGKSYAVLSDILGDEDHLGDMDFKV